MKSCTPLVILTSLVATACTSTSPVAPDATASRSAITAGATTSSDVNRRTNGDGALPLAAPTRNSNIVHVPFFIQDANGQQPTRSDTLLFEARQHNPILAPDGHQVTLAEFTAVEGDASVQCLNGGTHATLHLRHLIANGVYTSWNLVFKAPGFDPTFANLIGLGAIGAPTGTQNAFRASATGEGDVSAITAPGPLSVFGSIGACALTDSFEWHLVGAYHIDGQSHGATLGAAGTAVEQFGFMFKR
jgi:hypothetical protein